MKRSAASTLFGCAAVLLSYPEDTFADDLGSVGRSLPAVPAGRARSALEAALTWLSPMTSMEAAAVYVDTFDLRRGTSLYLSWYRHGDTRERGMALAALVDVYRSAGYRMSPGELPDFFPALLELAACHPLGASILAEHRVALDGLLLALQENKSGYAPAVAAVIEALPAPSRSDRAALQRYRDEGPPSELVGLEPYAPPELLGEKGLRS